METNLNPNHSVSIYDISFNDFGDAETLGEPTILKCLLEDTQGYENDAYSDDTVGNIVCQIFPSEPYYLANAGKLAGKVAQFNRFGIAGGDDWYKVASVRPGESLYDAEPDLVELTLTKIAARNEVEDAG